MNEEAKEEHTKDVASQLDDKLVALLAETPAAAAFVDTHAIQSIPVTGETFQDSVEILTQGPNDHIDCKTQTW